MPQTSEIEELVEGYWKWLRDKTVIKGLKDWAEITTPYLDRHNDYIQIYMRSSDNGFILTDDGYTLNDLQMSGCPIESPKRKKILETILNGFGVMLTGESIEVQASAENFALRKHNLIQAMLAVNDMFFLSSPTIKSLFFEDVAAWFDEADIRYTPRVKFAGHTGFDHLFDFAIPKTKDQPERIVQAINKPNRNAALILCQAWVDTKETRPNESVAFALLNDSQQTISSSVQEALKSYQIEPVAWRNRERYRTELAA